MPDVTNLVIHTLLFTLETVVLAMPFGVGLAWLLVRSDLPGRRAGLCVVALVLFLPLYIQASAWQAGFGREGWYSVGQSGEAWLTGWYAALWVHVLASIPWIVLIAGLGLRTVEPALEEQALLDGSPWQVFFRVTLPACWPALGLAAAWVAILIAGEMTVTSIFMVRTYTEEVYNQIAANFVTADAISALAPGIVGTMGLLGLVIYYCMRLARPDRPLNMRPNRVVELGSLRWPLLLALTIMLLFLAGVPLANLLYKAGVVVVQNESGRVRTWSAAKCLRIIAEAPVRCKEECFWSLSISALAATAAAALAVPLAWFARQSKWRGAAVMFVAIFCVALPGPLLGLAVIHLLNRQEVPWLASLYDHSILAPWLVLTVRALGPAVLVIWYAVRTIPAPVLDSAATEGCGPLGQLWYIVLPQRRAALAVAWLIGLSLALGDFAASALVVPPGVQTLSILIFQLAHYGVEDQLAGICLALILFLGLISAIVAWLGRRL